MSTFINIEMMMISRYIGHVCRERIPAESAQHQGAHAPAAGYNSGPTNQDDIQ